MSDVRTQFAGLVQPALCVASLVAVLLTVVYPAWIETLLGLDPDQASGLAEWLVLGLTAGIAVVTGLRARRNLRQSDAQPELR
jgi:hypothetical protein